MQESNISLKAILRTGNTGYTCNHVEISTWISPRPAEGPSWSTSLPSVLHRSPPKGSARHGLRRPWVGGPSIHRCIDPALHVESSSSSRRHPFRPRPRHHPFPLSLSVRQTLFNLDAAASEHALGEHVHRAPPPVAQERWEFGRGGQKK